MIKAVAFISKFKVIIAISMILIMISTVSFSYLNTKSSEDCLETARFICPDGIASYHHSSDFFEGDSCTCECL